MHKRSLNSNIDTFVFIVDMLITRKIFNAVFKNRWLSANFKLSIWWLLLLWHGLT